jgi:uncharacterized SAM-binding protein YcdF (DUF218 family)
MHKATHQVDELAKILWDYHHVHHELVGADCILVLGNHDLAVVDYAIELFKQGWAPLMIFSGGSRNPLLTSNPNQPEAVVFAERAVEMGVPRASVLVESKSRNTGDNFTLTADLLRERALDPANFIVVQKPYMERRTLATGLKRWPQKRLIITSPKVSYDDYITSGIPKDQIINFMVGDLQRIKVYGENGFQVRQEIPEQVWNAYLALVGLGYTKRLLPDSESGVRDGKRA